MKALPTIFFLALVAALPTVASAGSPDIYYNNFEFPDMRTIGPEAVMKPGEMSPMPANGGICQGDTNSGICTGLTGIEIPQCSVVNEPGNCIGNWCGRCSLSANQGPYYAIFYSGTRP